jgi:hypothetical protein
MNAEQIDDAGIQILREFVAISPEHARRIVARMRHAGLFRKADPDQMTCKHTHKNGIGSAGSDGSSSFIGHCLDCGKDLSYKIEGQLADQTLQLQPRN